MEINKWFDGTNIPSKDLGKSGDYYLRLDNGDIFNKKISVWQRVGNIKGEKGEQGESGLHGRDGLPGLDGENGTKWFDGVGLPKGEEGKPGDYHLDIENGDIYKKSTEDNWERIGNVKGNPGDNAYELALKNGFNGTLEEWLVSLNGNGEELNNIYEEIESSKVMDKELMDRISSNEGDLATLESRSKDLSKRLIKAEITSEHLESLNRDFKDKLGDFEGDVNTVQEQLEGNRAFSINNRKEIEEIRKANQITGEDYDERLNSNRERIDKVEENAVKVFKNVEEMKNCTDLKEGMCCKTLGYYESNDGGGAEYVVSEYVKEDDFYEDLYNSKYSFIQIKGQSISFKSIYNLKENLKSNITLKENLEYDGKGVVIKQKDSDTDAKIIVNNNTKLKNFNFQTMENALWIIGKKNIVIKKTYFKNIYNSAIFIYNCENIIIENCEFNNIEKSAIVIDDESKNITIQNCKFNNPKKFGGYEKEQINGHIYCLSGDNIKVINNIVKNSGGQGIFFGMNTSTKKGTTNSLAFGNYCEGNGQEGITNFGLLKNDKEDSVTNNNKIIGNTCINNRYHQIEVWTADSILVSNNIVIEEESKTNGNIAAITLFQSCDTFVNNNIIKTATNNGIGVLASSKKCSLINNIIEDFNTKKNTKTIGGNGILLDSNGKEAVSAISVKNNVIKGSKNTLEKFGITNTSIKQNKNIIVDNIFENEMLKDNISYFAKQSCINYILQREELNGKNVKRDTLYTIISEELNQPSFIFVKASGKIHLDSFGAFTYRENIIRDIKKIENWKVGDIIKSECLQSNTKILKIDKEKKEITIDTLATKGGSDKIIYDAVIKEI